MPLLPVSELEKISPIFRNKIGNAFLASVRKLLSISELSDIYDELGDYRGADFAGAFLDRLEVSRLIGGAERLLELPDGPFITVSNHPYGGVDGVVLVDILGHLRPGFKVMVNEFLNRIETLKPTWIVVNPKNKTSDEVTARNIQGVKDVLDNLKAGDPVGFFPSGAISDFKLKGFSIRDREWQEPLVKLIMKARVPVVPIRFFDRNSAFFYFLGLMSWKIRTLRLPREIANKKRSVIRVGVGNILTVEEQSRHQSVEDFGRWLRDSVYGMPVPEKFEEYTEFARKTKVFH